jgi:uncharacterized damage-inducible protein DinB
MTSIDHFLTLTAMYRDRTLGTLAAIEKLPDPQHALGWRPGPGRAHLGWQLLHIGVTEELFATERFLGTTPGYQELLPRFRGGSTPDDILPTIDQIKDVLTHSRQHLLTTISTFTDKDLEVIPPALKERGLTIGKALLILSWHEAHHQGQSHITLNLYKAAHA